MVFFIIEYVGYNEVYVGIRVEDIWDFFVWVIIYL